MNLYKSFYVFLYIFKRTTKMYSTVIYEYGLNVDTQIQKLESSLRWIRIFGTLHVQLKCHTQHNVYSHLDMYTSDVSRFKYRVNQPRMYRTNRHINTYRVYGSIISTNIHKPGRCTFLCYNSILFLAMLLEHLGPFRCVPLMVHLYYYYCWMHIQPDWHICRSGIAIKMKCLRVLSIKTDLCSK